MRILNIAGAFGIAMAVLATQAKADDGIRLCTGGESGVYYAAGLAISKMAGARLAIEVIPTEGTIDNLERTLDTKECDAMIGQPDGPAWMARQSPAKVRNLRQIASLHREYLHVICNRDSGINDLNDLEGGKRGKLEIGEPGSGGWLVWQNIVAEDKGYESVPVGNESGILALSAISSGDSACMLVPAGTGNGTSLEAAATFADTVRLAGANDKDFNDAKDIKGDALYEYAKIPKRTYDRPFQKGNVSTISWNAGVYINTESFTDKAKMTAFITAVSRAALGIKAEYGK